MVPIRVRVARQPTFTRYIFDLSELIGVSAHNDKDRLTLTFDALLRFDLADAKATLPPVITAIESEIDQDAVQVRFAFGGKADVRTFREDLSYMVDVASSEARGRARKQTCDRTNSRRSSRIWPTGTRRRRRRWRKRRGQVRRRRPRSPLLSHRRPPRRSPIASARRKPRLPPSRPRHRRQRHLRPRYPRRRHPRRRHPRQMRLR